MNLWAFCPAVALLLLGVAAVGASADVDPEWANVTQLIERQPGLSCEQHFATTEDAFVLSIQRIVSAAHSKTRGVVVLQHGLLDSSATWVINPRKESLGFILADAGYDVWLPNNRGNVYSNRNTKWTEKDAQFWAWSFDQLAKFDVPTILSYVRKEAEVAKVTWIGHSRGTQQMFLALSATPSISSQIERFIALAPVAFCHHMTSTLLVELAKWDTWEILLAFGVHDFMPSRGIFTKFLPDICKLSPNICDNVMYIICGCCDKDDFNQTRLDVYWNHFPAGSSVQGIVHYAQLVNKEGVVWYDYGSAGANDKHYGTPTPPSYNLSAIPTSLPIHLFAGGHDALADPADVHTLYGIIQKSRAGTSQSAPVTLKMIPPYTHMDFVWGMYARDNVYAEVVKILSG